MIPFLKEQIHHLSPVTIQLLCTKQNLVDLSLIVTWCRLKPTDCATYNDLMPPITIQHLFP